MIRGCLVSLALWSLTACPAPQVGHLEGPGVMEEPKASGTIADGGQAPTVTEGRVGGEATVAARADRDGDGVADADDPCPDGAELMNGYQDDDGCPDDPPRIVIPDVDPATVPKIAFAAGKATIAPTAYPILDELARLLLAHPELELVEVQGHVDGRERGKGLDVARAEAVRKALVDRGVDTARLRAKGYGATRPLDAATTDAARARNRRVELSIALRVDDP
jgi:outer membrane protein OmpA-like peptidoglycan-associated protein